MPFDVVVLLVVRRDIKVSDVVHLSSRDRLAQVDAQRRSERAFLVLAGRHAVGALPRERVVQNELHVAAQGVDRHDQRHFLQRPVREADAERQRAGRHEVADQYFLGDRLVSFRPLASQVGAGAVRPVLRDGPSRVEVENEVVEILERRSRNDVHAVFRVERVGHVQFVAGVDVRIEQRGGRVERVVSARGPVVEAGLVQR